MSAAAALPAATPAQPQSVARDFLTIALGEDLFAIPVSLVHEVLDPAPVTRVPNAPVFAPGLVNVRGNVLPMLDLRARFGLEPAPDTASTRLIVSEVAIEGGDPFEVAIKTDAVFAVVPVRDEEIASVPEYGSRWPSRFLAGVVRDEGRFVLLLDVPRLVETH
ncbi:chemotaxis protein CheW [Aureimonas jatrophae]|jgi:purine-binding chemotaxis protein CheW|uniref:Purine-binding chemotaxis protein CheW n=1 Tax=Aureimonas jatrophae TaxID=1166073 RepID=A0A1H0CU84_9HYPH|nr:chemotaxis protein CheW [Aureimonas jatrophae]MBB3951650.1 purine-binding chemotaxis protein CheW [Aureimonas jatrophae]SDN61434.1 purine-binding chemotaxis protein CheW [Aureimonas jatrophae]